MSNHVNLCSTFSISRNSNDLLPVLLFLMILLLLLSLLLLADRTAPHSTKGEAWGWGWAPALKNCFEILNKNARCWHLIVKKPLVPESETGGLNRPPLGAEGVKHRGFN